MNDDNENPLCRRCAHVKIFHRDSSIFPIYFCKEHPGGLDSRFMNDPVKECFEKKITGPWRMPEGCYTEEEYRENIIFQRDEFITKDDPLDKDVI